ncbi:hypothetical protein [Desulforamulus putei]|uniref:hypothetical protein n=1 Tax=Desulforamulus putei TaxID=74701 RepID=UPI002FDDE6E8
MAWSGSDCRMFVVPVLFSGLTNQNTAAQPANNTGTGDQNDPSTENAGTEKSEKENPTAVVTVVKVEVTKNGNTRAVCRVENGKDDQIIIAKNGVGKTLQDGLNKKFEIEYNVMKDGEAWFAIRAKQL